MHFSKFLSYLSVISVGVIFTVSETHAGPLVSRDGDDSVPFDPEVGLIFNATVIAEAVLLGLIQGGLSRPQMLTNTTIPNISGTLMSFGKQLSVLQTMLIEELGVDTNLPNGGFPALDNCGLFAPVNDAADFSESLVYITSAVLAAVQGYTLETLVEFSISSTAASTMLSMPLVLSDLQLFASQMLFGPDGSTQGDISPSFTPFEASRALTPFAGNCSFDGLDPTGQSTTFSSVPPVGLVSSSGQPLSPPIIIPFNSTLNINTTQLRDSDNCKPDAPGLSCQIMALQEIQSFLIFGLPVSITVLPINECIVTKPGVNNVYVTSDDTPLPTGLADRANMPIDTICAGPTYVYVHESITLTLS
ncbi:hypothetical protein Clacol_008668 [Clathrus columnatus]|uniref:Uncharacterized protein n=1 Tax=Clathrus columnatus TaxID=1419009 RepID=A0AAV5AMQ2_9AGAM|nr:hypothetical protein Clacol_008668 [Clathrus columnatus]